MKKVNKIAVILVLIILGMFLMGMPAYATGTTSGGSTSGGSTSGGGGVSFSSSGWLDTPTPEDSNLIQPTRTVMGQIISIIQVIGVSVAIIMLIVLAIKYLMSAPNDRAEIKKHAVVYVVGAIVLFAASGILQIIKDFSEEALGTAAGSSQNQTQEPG